MRMYSTRTPSGVCWSTNRRAQWSTRSARQTGFQTALAGALIGRCDGTLTAAATTTVSPGFVARSAAERTASRHAPPESATKIRIARSLPLRAPAAHHNEPRQRSLPTTEHRTRTIKVA
jgi:hypothetical protein